MILSLSKTLRIEALPVGYTSYQDRVEMK